MADLQSDIAPRRLARIAGLLYLVIIVCGVLSEAALRAPLIDVSDAQATAENLAASSMSFRFSILLDVIMALSDVALAVCLYRLLEPVSRTLSLAAMTFRLVQASILGLNLSNLQVAAALSATPILEPQGHELVLTFLDAHAMGYDLALFFFGIDCVLVGILLYRADFGPNAISALMCAAGAVYLVGSTAHVLVPHATEALAPAYAIPLVAELSMCLWLLLRVRPLRRVELTERQS